MNKNVKKIFVFVALILFLISIYKAVSTFAVFESELNSTTDAEIGVWKIVVNGSEITAGNVESFEINQIEVNETQYVRKGKIAPGYTATFSINIDPSDTQTSIEYSISIDKSKLPNERIKLISVTEKEYNNELIFDEDKYVGVMTLQDILAGKTNTIAVEIKWEDLQDKAEEDALLSLNEDATLTLPITVNVRQHY